MDDDVSPVWCSSLCEMTACLVSSISIFFLIVPYVKPIIMGVLG